jgi:hypothetical protein
MFFGHATIVSRSHLAQKGPLGFHTGDQLALQRFGILPRSGLLSRSIMSDGGSLLMSILHDTAFVNRKPYVGCMN